MSDPIRIWLKDHYETLSPEEKDILTYIWKRTDAKNEKMPDLHK